MSSDTPLGQALAATHEMYAELRAAGFKKSESLELIARYMVALGNSQMEQEDER